MPNPKENPMATLREYEAEREDERIRAVLIIRATELADLLDVTPSELAAVTEAIIASQGTRTSDGRCRLCGHDHDPILRAAREVRDALKATGDRAWKRAALAVLEASLTVALDVEPHSKGSCPCDLAQVGPNDV
jgi:hypothetical protein